MREKLIIEVTSDDIANGKRCTLTACPIARAMTRQKGIRVYKPGRFSLHGTPNKAKGFIDRFDRGDKVEPMTLTLTRYR